jgi:prostaglandin-endoperoxide synthase 2
MKRDTSRDGLSNQIRYWALTNGRPFWALSNRVPPLRKLLNRLFVDNAIGFASTRPYPFSTLCDYTSVDSLRDRTWFGRHLPPVAPKPNLPDPARVAALFKRKEGAKLSSKSTMLFASFAQWFTDGFLLTDMKDRRRTHTNHELDLSQLYGLNRDITNALRVRSEQVGRRGRLKSQIIDGEEYPPFLYDAVGQKKVEFDLVPEPIGIPDDWPVAKKRTVFAAGGERTNSTPQTAMINALMLREHNRICGELERNNPGWDDERVFQTARNIVIVIQLRIVVEEYVNHISPYHHDLLLDPSLSWKAVWNRPPWFAVEFNMLYRWHSLIPDAIQWGERSYPLQDWLIDNTPLIDVGLGAAFEATSRQAAGEIELGNTPDALLHAEGLAIEQGRRNRVGSYNDYREAMGYPRAERFEQISSSETVIRGLRELYGHVDNVEFYVGLFAEDPRPNSAAPALLGRMVASDAFSQALVNPLVSEHIYNAATFSPAGLQLIEETRGLADLVARNVKNGNTYAVYMTQPSVAPKPGVERRLTLATRPPQGPPVYPAVPNVSTVNDNSKVAPSAAKVAGSS